jgi:MFS family permease
LTRNPNESPVPTGEARGAVPQDTGLAFAALHHRDFRPYFLTTMLSMMADNIEHVISYWVIFEIFHSPTLAGFAVVSHWLPFLLLSWYFGGLSDRFDYRRIIQASQLMYMGVSVAWAILIVTDSLEVWHAAVLLVVHGLAGTLWGPGSQLILHNLVGPEHLQSAVRLNATGRQLGVLLGPAVGGALMLILGPYVALLVNTLIYLPLTVWLQTVPYAGRRPEGSDSRKFSWTTALRTLREGNHIVVSMVCLAGVASFFIGTAFQAQMPEFAHDLGTDGMGYGYAALLAANGAGAVVGGLLLEGKGMLAASARTATLLAMLWCITLGAFSVVSIYPLALVLLFMAGILNLSFMSMTQTLVQLNAPPALRGRFLGLYIMCAQGLKTFSGVTVGVVGGYIGIHWSLGLSAAMVFVLMISLFALVFRVDKANPSIKTEGLQVGARTTGS